MVSDVISHTNCLQIARHSSRGTNPAALGGKSRFPNDRLGIKTIVSRSAVCQ